ncbi:MAG: Hpt domain-containing protein [Endozoicomonadaceae bacterium]|nr:Hpt domain-containing protein [Endozoicomonadaceae bacterium]
MLDMVMLREFFGDDNDIRDILVQFIQTTDHDIQQLGQAISERDVDQVAELTHRIKGSSLVVGADEMVRIVGEMEADARIQNDYYFDELYAALTDTYRYVSEEIRAI